MRLCLKNKEGEEERGSREEKKEGGGKTEGGGNQFILKVAVPFLGVLFCVVYLAMYLCVVFKCGSVVAYELNYITQTRR